MERTAGTFQDRLITELRLAGATTIEQANTVLEQFLPRFNRRFQVPPPHPEPAFRPLDPELCLEQVRCFKHRRRVVRDNTVRYQLHTLQLLAGPGNAPAMPGRRWRSCKDWTAGCRCGRLFVRPVVGAADCRCGRLSVRHEGRIIAAQAAPVSPVFLRNGHGRSASGTVPPSGVGGLGERWIETLEPLHSRSEDDNDPSMIIDDVVIAGKPAATSARRPTFLQADFPSEESQKERWKAIQKARRKGMSLRSIEREMGIHRGTIKKYLEAEGPPTRPSRVVSSTSSSDTIQA